MLLATTHGWEETIALPALVSQLRPFMLRETHSTEGQKGKKEKNLVQGHPNGPSTTLYPRQNGHWNGRRLSS
jgi:hypothetical protein